MPTKIETETQLCRLLANSSLQVNLTLIVPQSHESKNTSFSHLERFYTTFDKIKNNKYDGMIITGAPVEHLEFKDVDYYSELKEIFEFSKTNVTSTMFICWGAQAALNYFYGIKKYPLEKKLFGVFKHKKSVIHEVLLNGIGDIFYVPQSRHTYNLQADLLNEKKLDDNYKKYDSWYTTPEIPKKALNNLEEMLIDNNNLKEKIPYEELVYELN